MYRENYKVLVASLVGSAIEWYDYFLYGTVAALVFNQIFFVTDNPEFGLLYAYASFALAFFIRPFGGIIFSHIGDKVGRKKTLIMTLALMGGATFLMGLLPTYESIGIMAPIFLIILRLIQGIGLGGEWGGAMLLAVEYAPKEKRGFYGSIPQTGVTIGLLLGTASLSLMTMLDDEDFLSWGWRIPFIVSIGLVALGLWIRKGIDETPSFRKTKEEGDIVKIPLFTTLKFYWKEVLISICAKAVETAPFYIFCIFIVSYATKNLGFDKTTVLNSIIIAMIITTILIPFMGILSDKIGRKKLFIIGSIAMAAFAFPYFWLLEEKTNTSLLIATILGVGIIWAPITAVLGTMFSEIFSAKIRYTGISLGYQIGAAIAGGTAPLIATALLMKFDNSYVPIALYIVFLAVISIVAVLKIENNYNTHLDD